MMMQRMQRMQLRVNILFGQLPSRAFSQGATTTGKKQQQLFQEELNIIYDSKCNICKLEMDWLARRDANLSASTAQRKLKLTDIESEDYDPNEPANGGVTYEKGMAAIHAVTPDGRVIEGVPVFSKAYELVELGWLFRFTEWSIMKPVVQYGYEVFAKYRTNVTRGSSLQDLVKAHYEKRTLQTNNQEEECNRCNSIKR